VLTAGEEFNLNLPFSDHASVENCFHCVLVLLHFGFKGDQIQERISTLRSIPMRLERVILSDIHESGLPDPALMKKVSSLLTSAHIQEFVGIGPVLFSYQQEFPPGSLFYRSTEDFIKNFNLGSLQNEVILVKGARVFAFERIVNQLQRKVHGTVMEIDLGALVHNLNHFKACLRPTAKIMAMVKAFAYGSGSNEIANVLQYHKIDYLGVAYADEGVELRKNNISLPVMVMNPAEESFEALLRYKLEPEIYSFRIFQRLCDFLGGRPCNVHVKLDTGMHRLGFDMDEVDGLITLLLERPNVRVASLFSHLAGADEEEHDTFTRQQGEIFRKMADSISQRLNYRPLYHVLNSSGILRFPEFQFDMVRLGIGLYGVNPAGPEKNLKPVASLKTIISQIKHIPAGESIGYGRKGHADRPTTTATIAIGYADGFSRAFSQGVGKVMIKGRPAPVIGNVCMDMTMVDITDIPAREGDEVVIFGKELPIQEVAESIGTIPYEILTSTSERVKRIFVAESI
jgi:alanine racemase